MAFNPKIIFSGKRKNKTVDQQAYAWIRKVATGNMTHAEGAALKNWCKQHPDHGAAFSKAHARWKQIGEAGLNVLTVNPMASRDIGNQIDSRQKNKRRLFLGGALGATMMTTGALAVTPPWGLWPSMDEWRADYRTDIGEQRELVLAKNVQVVLNTRTSISVWKRTEPGMELISGQIAVDLQHSTQRFGIEAGGAQAWGQDARFDVQYVPEGVCITCLQGSVQIRHKNGQPTLQAMQKIVYSKNTLGNITVVDAVAVSAWRDGFLRFVDTPLGDVIDEINRYRPGRIVLMDQTLSSKVVTGRFKVDALDKAIAQIQYSLNIRARALPGNVIVLG